MGEIIGSSIRLNVRVAIDSEYNFPPYCLGCSEAGMMRVPGILAGLNDRSQSAYAAPAPKPVERAIGHARPVVLCVALNKGMERNKRVTNV